MRIHTYIHEYMHIHTYMHTHTHTYIHTLRKGRNLPQTYVKVPGMTLMFPALRDRQVLKCKRDGFSSVTYYLNDRTRGLFANGVDKILWA